MTAPDRNRRHANSVLDAGISVLAAVLNKAVGKATAPGWQQKALKT